MLAGEVGNIVLVDVTPLTLGIETLGNVATSLIPRNTPIPVKRSEIFTTAADLQTSVNVHVFQGERPMASDNISLGQFNLDGLPPAPRGVPRIEVSFDIDADGILNATAKDTASGRSQSIRITGSTRLPEAEKRRMVEQAERYAEDDRKRREAAEQLNDADAVCYQAERTSPTTATKSPKSCEGGSKRPCAIRGRLLPPRTLRRRRARLTLSKPCSRKSDKAFTRTPSWARGRAWSNPPVRRLRPAALEWSMPNTSRRRPSLSL